LGKGGNLLRDSYKKKENAQVDLNGRNES
jgi:hypothetical protein